jgi:hypothetical protein
VVGLIDRGVLRATFNEPRRYPAGIIHVIVNGVAMIDGGVHTTALPGRVATRGHGHRVAAVGPPKSGRLTFPRALWVRID